MAEDAAELIEEWRWDGTQDAYLPQPGVDLGARVPMHTQALASVDPVDYEIVRHRLWMINDEHASTLKRISGSPIVVFGHDFNTSLLLEDGEWVYFGPYILYLNAGADLAVKWILENRSEDPGIGEGDIFVTNDPWIGTNHTIDIVMAAPIFHEGELFCWVSNHMHHYDLGGITPGSFCPTAETIFEEAPAFPPMRLFAGGERQREVEEMILRTSRQPDLVALDLRAGIAGCNVARQRLRELIGQFGAETVKGVMRKIVDSSEQGFLDKLQGIPDGVWRDSMSVESARGGSGELDRLTLRMTKQGDRLIFDNEGTSPQSGAMNTTLIGLRGAIGASLMPTLLHDQLFAVGGMLRHLEVRPEPNTMSAASPPAAVSCYVTTIICLMRLALSCLGKAMALNPDLVEDILTSSAAVPYPLTTFSGLDESGTPFISIVMEPMASGASASAAADGVASGGHFWDPRAGIPNVEDAEDVSRVLYLYRREVADTGGAGLRRGGIGVEAAMVSHGAERIDHAVSGGGHLIPGTVGILGGLPAPTISRALLKGSNVREVLDGATMPGLATELSGDREEMLPGVPAEQGPDDVFIMRANGGGGFRDPIEREPVRVAADVAADAVSEHEARRVYGVVVAGGEVDTEATERRRDEIRAERLGAKPSAGESEPDDVLASVAGVLAVVPGEPEPELACGRCGTRVGTVSGGYRGQSARRDLELSEIAPGIAPTTASLDDDIVLREHCCPGCARLFDAAVVPRGSEVEPDMSLEIVAPEVLR